MHCALLLAIDLLLLIIANGIAFFLSIGTHPDAFVETLLYCGLTVASAIPVLLMTGLNRTLWRFTSLHDCSRIVIAVLLTMTITAAVASTLPHVHSVPQFLMGLQFLLMTASLIGIRAGPPPAYRTQPTPRQ